MSMADVRRDIGARGPLPLAEADNFIVAWGAHWEAPTAASWGRVVHAFGLVSAAVAARTRRA